MFRFTIRDLLWLMVVVGLTVGWWIEHRQKASIEIERRNWQARANALRTIYNKAGLSTSVEFNPDGESIDFHEPISTMSRPSKSTVEAILSQLDAVPSGPGFELWIPQHLTLRDQPVRADVAMAVIVDKILGMGYQPDGFSEADGRRVYRYKVMK